MIQTPNASRFPSSSILAALLLLVPLSSCGGHHSAMDQAAASLCDKYAQCAGYQLSGSDMNQCKQEIAVALTVLPDPTSFEACVAQVSCTILLDDTAASPALEACLNLDMTSVHCNSDQKTLHACTNTPVCTEIDCKEVCSYFAGGSFVNCGYDSSRSHDVCWCQM
jgi:hypothetical protein